LISIRQRGILVDVAATPADNETPHNPHHINVSEGFLRWLIGRIGWLIQALRQKRKLMPKKQESPRKQVPLNRISLLWYIDRCRFERWSNQKRYLAVGQIGQATGQTDAENGSLKTKHTQRDAYVTKCQTLIMS